MDVATQLRNALRLARLPIPTIPWLQTFLTTQSLPSTTGQLSPSTLQTILAAARTHILASDLTAPAFLDLSLTATFPLHTSFKPENIEQKLPNDVFVQILDIEDLTHSRWDQIDELESMERGEFTKGREIIRLAPEEDDENPASTALTQTPGQGRRGGVLPVKKNATHRLVVQDVKGFKAFAMELSRVESLGVGTTTIGAKMMISRGALICRGTILLEPSSCAVLGGGVASWHKKWLEERKKRLQEIVAGKK